MTQRQLTQAAAALAALIAGFASLPAQAQTKPPIVARAEQCLRQNVDRVVAADRDLASAANFLVTYACPAEIEGARRYERNSAYVQMFSQLFKSLAQTPLPVPVPVPGKPAAAPMPEFKASVDPETGEIVLPPQKAGAPPNPVATIMPMMENLFGQVAPDVVPVGLRKLAGELVLAASARAR